MPTYDYVCESCRHEFEQFQSITAKSLRKCPKCGANALKRLIGSGAGIIFKGSGFYETDYRSDSYKQGQKSEKSGGKTAASDKTDKKPETKTETKAETKSAGKTASADKKKSA